MSAGVSLSPKGKTVALRAADRAGCVVFGGGGCCCCFLCKTPAEE